MYQKKRTLLLHQVLVIFLRRDLDDIPRLYATQGEHRLPLHLKQNPLRAC